MNNTLIEMMNKDMEVAKNVIALKINITKESYGTILNVRRSKNFRSR